MPPSKVYVLTGGTSGIGRALALALARGRARIELLGRNAERGEAVVRRIDRALGRGSARFHPVDLGDFARVRQVAEELACRHAAIDVLVNNAGARNDRFRTTASGLELTFAANHLGHFLLTCLLLDRLVAARQGRVVTVASGSHFDATTTDGWLFEEDNYDRRQAYARSKLANVMFSRELASRARNTAVTSLAVDPGNVASTFAGNNGLVARAKHLVSHALRRNLILPTAAAAALARVVDSQEFAGYSGTYWEGDVPAATSPLAGDAGAASRLWTLSVELTGINAANCRAWALVAPPTPG